MKKYARKITSRIESEELQEYNLSETDIEHVKSIVNIAIKFWNHYILPKENIQVSVGCTYILYNFFAVIYPTEPTNKETCIWKLEFNIIILKDYLHKIKESIWDENYTGEQVLTAIVIHELSHTLDIGGSEFQCKFNEDKKFKSNTFHISFLNYIQNIFQSSIHEKKTSISGRKRLSFLDRIKYRYYIALIFCRISNYKSRELSLKLKLDHDRKHVEGSLIGELEETAPHSNDPTKNNRMALYDHNFALIASLGHRLNDINIFHPITIEEIIYRFKNK